MTFHKSKKETHYYDLDQRVQRDRSFHVSKKTIDSARVNTREQKEDLLTRTTS